MRVGDAPAHHHHQVKSEGEEQHGGDAILDADHFVIGGENVFRPESWIVVMIIVVMVIMGVVPGVCVGVRAHGSVLRRWLIQIMGSE